MNESRGGKRQQVLSVGKKERRPRIFRASMIIPTEIVYRAPLSCLHRPLRSHKVPEGICHLKLRETPLWEIKVAQISADGV